MSAVIVRIVKCVNRFLEVEGLHVHSTFLFPFTPFFYLQYERKFLLEMTIRTLPG